MTTLPDKSVGELLAGVHGPRGAAWLVRRFKRSLRATGEFAVDVDMGKRMDLWFRLALKAFKMRDHVWRVRMETTTARRSALSPMVSVYRYRVQWLLWGGPLHRLKIA